MTNPIHYQNQTVPSYSGVTINITNPTLNTAPLSSSCPKGCYNSYPNQPNFYVQAQGPNQMACLQGLQIPQNFSSVGQGLPENDSKSLASTTMLTQEQEFVDSQVNNPINPEGGIVENNSKAYPPQYYLNNYNYMQNGEKEDFQPSNQALNQVQNPIEKGSVAKDDVVKLNYNIVPQQEDMSSSENIKNELDARLAEQKELEKNGTKTKVVALTNEYIMSLENYLNNPNTEIRLMAAKEILTRLDEDKDRHGDAALNALLNKMLQDPEKLIRIAALSAFSSQLASGNEFTFELLNNIQKDPNADKEDVVQAADCLLKMSSSTETKFMPAEKQIMVPQQAEG